MNINLDNTVRAAEYILKLDSTAINKLFLEDAHYWVTEIQETLARYYRHMNSTEEFGLLTAEEKATLIANDLKRLMLYTKDFIRLLIPIEQEELKAFLATPCHSNPT